jgi:hypothetical protein
MGATLPVTVSAVRVVSESGGTAAIRGPRDADLATNPFGVPTYRTTGTGMRRRGGIPMFAGQTVTISATGVASAMPGRRLQADPICRGNNHT